jgi:hypothetical protein
LGATTSSQDLGSGISAVPFSFGLSSLQPGTTYYYRVDTVANGLTSTYAIQSFTTPGEVPTMPQWGYAFMATALLFVGARKLKRTA